MISNLACVIPTGTFTIYMLMCAFTIVFATLWVPETKGRTLEEIQWSFRWYSLIAILIFFLLFFFYRVFLCCCYRRCCIVEVPNLFNEYVMLVFHVQTGFVIRLNSLNSSNLTWNLCIKKIHFIWDGLFLVLFVF